MITEKVSGLSVPRMSVTIQSEFLKCTVTCIEDSGLEAETELGRITELFCYALAGIGFHPSQVDSVLKADL